MAWLHSGSLSFRSKASMAWYTSLSTHPCGVKTDESAAGHEDGIGYFTVLQGKYHCGSFLLFALGWNFVCD